MGRPQMPTGAGPTCWQSASSLRAARLWRCENQGVSGGRLISDGMGVSALARFDRDVLAQPGVDTLILMIGLNDIGWPGGVLAPGEAVPRQGLIVKAPARENTYFYIKVIDYIDLIRLLSEL